MVRRWTNNVVYRDGYPVSRIDAITQSGGQQEVAVMTLDRGGSCEADLIAKAPDLERAVRTADMLLEVIERADIDHFLAKRIARCRIYGCALARQKIQQEGGQRGWVLAKDGAGTYRKLEEFDDQRPGARKLVAVFLGDKRWAEANANLAVKAERFKDFLHSAKAVLTEAVDRFDMDTDTRPRIAAVCKAIDRLTGSENRRQEGRECPEVDVPRFLFFKRGNDALELAGSFGTPEDLGAIAGDIRAKLGLTAPINVVETFRDLPAALREKVDENPDQMGNVRGVYWRAAVYVVHENIHSRADLEEVILHEGYGHYGARRLFGEEVFETLTEFFNYFGGAAGIREIAARHGLDMGSYFEEADRLPVDAQAFMLMDELLAHLQSESQGEGLIEKGIRKAKEILGRIRWWMDEKGFFAINRDYGDLELAVILAAMAKAARQPLFSTEFSTGQGVAAEQQLEVSPIT